MARTIDNRSFHEGSDYLPPDFWDFDAVQERMIEAITFLDRVSGGGAIPYAKDGPWHLIRRDRLVDYVDVDALREQGARVRGGLNVDEVGRMEEALEWIRYVPARGEHRRIVGVVLQMLATNGSQVRWEDVQRRLRSKQSVEVLRKSYGRAITLIATRLNARRLAG